VIVYGAFSNTNEASLVAGGRLGAGSHASALPRLGEDGGEDAAELEDIFTDGGYERGFFCPSRLFAFYGGNPELLPLAEEQDCAGGVPAAVILEKDGIPYINDDACGYGESLDRNFARLVESVAYNRGPP